MIRGHQDFDKATSNERRLFLAATVLGKFAYWARERVVLPPESSVTLPVILGRRRVSLSTPEPLAAQTVRAEVLKAATRMVQQNMFLQHVTLYCGHAQYAVAEDQVSRVDSTTNLSCVMETD